MTNRLIIHKPKDEILNCITKYIKSCDYEGEYYLKNNQLVVKYHNSHYSLSGAILNGILGMLLVFVLSLFELLVFLAGYLSYQLDIKLIAVIVITCMTLYGFIENKIYPMNLDYYSLYIKEIDGQTIVKIDDDMNKNSIEEDIMDFLILKYNIK